MPIIYVVVRYTDAGKSLTQKLTEKDTNELRKKKQTLAKIKFQNPFMSGRKPISNQVRRRIFICMFYKEGSIGNQEHT